MVSTRYNSTSNYPRSIDIWGQSLNFDPHFLKNSSSDFPQNLTRYSTWRQLGLLKISGKSTGRILRFHGFIYPINLHCFVSVVMTPHCRLDARNAYPCKISGHHISNPESGGVVLKNACCSARRADSNEILFDHLGIRVL